MSKQRPPSQSEPASDDEELSPEELEVVSGGTVNVGGLSNKSVFKGGTIQKGAPLVDSDETKA